jgi:hypothetical protein
MRLENFFKAAFLTIFFFLFYCPTFNALAGVIKGHVKDKQGKNAIPQASLILYNVTNKTDKPKMTISDSNGDFHFNVEDQSREYRLVVYSSGETREKSIDYRGQETGFEIKLGKKWYETEWFDKFLTFASFLGSFFLGLFSREITGWIRKCKTQNNITSIYLKSIEDFINEYRKTKDITITKDSEPVYSAIYAKFVFAKENLKTLLSYSWAVEKMDPKFFEKMLQRMSIIQAIVNTVPFDKEEKWDKKLIFLKNHHNEELWPPDQTAHKEFDNLLEKLQKDTK